MKKGVRSSDTHSNTQTCGRLVQGLVVVKKAGSCGVARVIAGTPEVGGVGTRTREQDPSYTGAAFCKELHRDLVRFTSLLDDTRHHNTALSLCGDVSTSVTSRIATENTTEFSPCYC